ncbi:hypothetical protein [Streptomyces sp. NPDC046197]|uniref:hypothetical protein n=1 Tax=Streptomyces sp. NPDC046197 TaxID=3154337 RepID=UPI0033F39811
MTGIGAVHVHGAVDGQVVVGERNVVINAQQGSSVSYRAEGPPPIRRRSHPVGRALPRRSAELLGRESELTTIGGWLAEGHPVYVAGAPGVGKSALLRRYAADQTAQGRDLVYLPAAGLPVEDLVQELFHTCFEAEDYKPEPARMRRLMGTVHALLVIDDFEGSAEELATLIDAAPGCDVLLATVERVSSGDGRELRLEGLPESAALALLARELGRTPQGEEEDAARRLIATVDGHPLALVQAAAAMRRAAQSGSTSEAGFTVDETAVAVGTAGRLSEGAARLLRLLCAIEPVPASARLLGVLSGGESVSTSHTSELEELRLIEGYRAGYRCCGRFATLVAEQTGTVPDPAQFAVALVRWLRTSASRQDATAEAPVILRVLEAAALRDDHAAVRDLARAVAPALARSLHWGAWGRVVERGKSAAEALGAASDLAYFSREAEVRKRALGLAGGLLVGGGAGAGAAAAHSAWQGGVGKGATVASRTGLKAMVSGPVALGTGAAVVVAGVVFVSLAGGKHQHPVAAPTPVPTVSGAPLISPTSSEQPSWTPSESVSASVSASVSDTPVVTIPRGAPPSGSGTCVPVTVAGPAFDPVPAPGRETEPFDFDAWLPCDDAKSLAVDDPVNWKVEPTSCPPPQESRHCRLAVTFQPRKPGDYHAKITWHDIWGQDDVTIEVSAVATTESGGPSDVPSSSVPTSPSAVVSPSPPVSPESPSQSVTSPPPSQ